MQIKTWKLIPKRLGFLPIYEVNNIGEVRAVSYVDKLGHHRRAHLLTVRLSRRGYPQVHLQETNHECTVANVHTLVASAFIPNPHHRTNVIHLNQDVMDNRASNLAWSDRLTHSNHKQFTWKQPRSNHVPVYIDSSLFTGAFTTVLAAAKCLYALDPSHTMKQYYHGISNVINGHAKTLYRSIRAYNLNQSDGMVSTKHLSV